MKFYDKGNKSLNFGREVIEKFIKEISFQNLLDIGAGRGEDLSIAKRINPKAILSSIELDDDNTEVLKNKAVHVYKMDLEKKDFHLRRRVLI